MDCTTTAAAAVATATIIIHVYDRFNIYRQNKKVKLYKNYL